MQTTTVLGAISSDALGVTLMHEHLILDRFWIKQDPDYIIDDVELVVRELMMFKEAGGSAVVETTTEDMGRNVVALRKIAERTGLHIIAGTGHYLEPYHSPLVRERSVNQLADGMIREITCGIGDTGIRAGIIGEIGSGRFFVSPAEERVLRAAARAHLQTGVPITTHAALGKQGLRQLEILKEEGMSPCRVVVGHVDAHLDLEYHESICKEGAYVAYDCVGKTHFCLDTRRVWMIVEMVNKGYVGQILLSSDVCRKSDLRTYGGFGYSHLAENFLPDLRRAGLDSRTIEVIMVENPRSVLACSLHGPKSA